MVQNGKFEAAAALFVKTLKNVDFPTFGTPTMPTRKLVPTRPINGLRSGSSTFFGGILKSTKTKEKKLSEKEEKRNLAFNEFNHENYIFYRKIKIFIKIIGLVNGGLLHIMQNYHRKKQLFQQNEHIYIYATTRRYQT